MVRDGTRGGGDVQHTATLVGATVERQPHCIKSQNLLIDEKHEGRNILDMHCKGGDRGMRNGQEKGGVGGW